MIRYLLVSFINRGELLELNYFPPVKGREKIGKTVYLVSNTALLFIPIVLPFHKDIASIAGYILYALSLIIYMVSIITFCQGSGLINKGIYSFSRNPQSLSFILQYTSLAIISHCWIYALLIIPLAWSFKLLALSEERWCKTKYGQCWNIYTRKTRRFI